IGTTTEISAFDRALTVQKLSEGNSLPNDFRRPGHIFPLVAKEGGVLQRTGHTEAAIDLARLSGSTLVGVMCEIMKDAGTMARVDDLKVIANQFDLKMITIKDLVHYRLKHDTLIDNEIEIELPTEFGNFKAIGFTSA